MSIFSAKLRKLKIWLASQKNLGKLLDLAEMVVRYAEKQSAWTGKQKRDYAIEEITEQANAHGIPVTEGRVRWAVETALHLLGFKDIEEPTDKPK